jgi:membrane fusion protein (multidrug efflux system)
LALRLATVRAERSYDAVSLERNRLAFYLAVATALLMTGAACSKRGAGGAPGGGFKPPPMPVEASPVVQAPIADRFEGVGTVEAGEAITVAAEIDGIVVALPFREGQSVAKGAVLARLDDVQLRAEVARAEALRDQARTTYERVKSVVEQAAGAAQDLDDAAAALKVAEANLALAQARLQKTRITAPWSGLAGARRVSPGAFVRAGQEITDLAAVRDIKVRFSAPERYLGVLQRGAPVTVSTPAFPGYTLEGRIDVVEPVLDANLRSGRLLARVPNPGEKLRPGMSANVSTVLSERANALTIPSEAVFVEGSQSFVYAIQPDSTVKRVAVTLGTRTPEVVEVTAGLEPGGRVVRAGHQKLFVGAKVMPVGEGPPAGEPPPAAAASGGAS